MVTFEIGIQSSDLLLSKICYHTYCGVEHQIDDVTTIERIE